MAGELDGISKLRLKLLEVGGPQYIIAARAGMAPSRLSEYTLLQKDIPIHHLVSLCKVLSCEPDEIIGTVDPVNGLTG